MESFAEISKKLNEEQETIMEMDNIRKQSNPFRLQVNNQSRLNVLQHNNSSESVSLESELSDIPQGMITQASEPISLQTQIMHSRSSSSVSALYRCPCEYKPPTKISKKSKFSSKYLVIDSRLNQIRLYRSEHDLSSYTNYGVEVQPKYKINPNRSTKLNVCNYLCMI